MSNSYRYPGVNAFSAMDQHLFFGRQKDQNELIAEINLEHLVILHGKSGLGKSSLINAGVVPNIYVIDNPDIPIKPILFRFSDYNQDRPETPLEIFHSKLIEQLPNRIAELSDFPQVELNCWLTMKQIILTEPSQYVLVFDQFEELLTYPKEWVTEFFGQLTELYLGKIPKRIRWGIKKSLILDNEFAKSYQDSMFKAKFDASLNLRFLIAIRSDRLNLIHRLGKFIPNALTNTFELQPFSIKHAEEAIILPARLDNISSATFSTPPFEYDKDTVSQMIDFLSNHGNSEIEPFQLQIICQNIEEIVKEKNLTKVGVEHVPSQFEDLLQQFYLRQVQKLNDPKLIATAREIVEEEFIVEEETDARRASVDELTLRNKYLGSQEILKKLVDFRLLRRETGSRKGVFLYELSHDTLVNPIVKLKQKRKEGEKYRKLIKWVGVSVLGVLCLTALGVLSFRQYEIKLNDEKLELVKAEAMKAEAETMKAEAVSDSLKIEMLSQKGILDSIKAKEETDKILAENKRSSMKARQYFETTLGENKKELRRSTSATLGQAIFYAGCQHKFFIPEGTICEASNSTLTSSIMQKGDTVYIYPYSNQISYSLKYADGKTDFFNKTVLPPSKPEIFLLKGERKLGRDFRKENQIYIKKDQISIKVIPNSALEFDCPADVRYKIKEISISLKREGLGADVRTKSYSFDKEVIVGNEINITSQVKKLVRDSKVNNDMIMTIEIIEIVRVNYEGREFVIPVEELPNTVFTNKVIVK